MQHLPLARWEHGISALALAASLVAVFFSYRAEVAASAPNVAVVNMTGSLSNTSKCIDDACEYDRIIYSVARIKNIGRAAVQIVSIEVEPFTTGRTAPDALDVWVSDKKSAKPTGLQVRSKEQAFFLNVPSIESMEHKDLFVFVVGNDPLLQLVGIRLKLEFSNGQKMTLMPQFISRISGATSN